MSLYEQLRQILTQPGILPSDAGTAILGSDLLERVRSHILGTYSDNSIRQTFSSLAGDPTSPLAKVEQGYGYYRRPPAIGESTGAEGATNVPTLAVTSVDAPLVVQSGVTSDVAATGGVVEATSSAAIPATTPLAGDRATQPEEKFRAFYLRHARLNASFPVHVEHTTGNRQQAGVNKWKFPDVVVLDWEVGEQREEQFVLDRALLEVKRSLGEQPFRLSSIELKVAVSLSNFREYFFQCVSNSKWAHMAQLVVASPISDALLAAELRRLGASYGVSVVYFNLPRERLDALPSSTQILALSDDEFEKLAEDTAPVVLASGAPRADLDWDHIRDMRAQSADFRDLFDWIARCLRDARAYTFQHFAQLRQIEREAG